MLKKLKNLVVQEEGQALSEYGLIIGLVAVLCITALTAFSTDISTFFTGLASKLGM